MRSDSERRELRQSLRKVLRRKKLSRVQSSETSDTIHSIIQQNEMFCRMRDMRVNIPEDHAEEIDAIRQERDLYDMMVERLREAGFSLDIAALQPRALKQLNLIERLVNGDEARRWTIDQAIAHEAMAILNMHAAPQSLQ